MSWQKLCICVVPGKLGSSFVVAIWIKASLPPALWCWSCSTSLSPLPPPFFKSPFNLFPSYLWNFALLLLGGKHRGREHLSSGDTLGDTAVELWAGKIQFLLKNNLSREWCLISRAEKLLMQVFPVGLCTTWQKEASSAQGLLATFCTKTTEQSQSAVSQLPGTAVCAFLPFYECLQAAFPIY